jgi:hypothetical protein
VGRLRSVNDVIKERDRVTNAWIERNRQLETELEEYRAGKRQPGQQPAAQPRQQNVPQNQAGADDVSALDWQTYQELHQQDPVAANYHLVQNLLNLLEGKVNRTLDTRVAPFQQQQAHYEYVTAATRMFEQVGAMEEDGEPVFPELQNPQDALEVIETWKSLGLSPDQALTPRAIRTAVLEYRHAKAREERRTGRAAAGSGQGHAPAHAPSTPSPAAAAVARNVTDAITRSEQGGNALGSGAPSRAAGRAPSPEENMRRGIRAASPVDPRLGFGR